MNTPTFSPAFLAERQQLNDNAWSMFSAIIASDTKKAREDFEKSLDLAINHQGE